MGSDTPKQYLDLCGKPVLYYSLKAFEDSFIDEIVIVASPEDHSYIREELVNRYGFDKVASIVEGGAERYHSVLCGLRAVCESDYVFIHDGARPFVDEGILKRAYETVKKHGSAIVAMPVKDTVKIVDDDGVTVDTPDRRHLWQMQTPQVFKYKEILDAYEKMLADPAAASGMSITDDAMVMEHFGSLKVHVSQGSYRNIKITTPEDMITAEAFLNSKGC